MKVCNTNGVTDTNECLSINGGCSHYCNNTIGSYHCECPTRYILQPNKHDCAESKLLANVNHH